MTECNFCRKYNMTQEDFLRAIRDGKISTTVLRHDELFTKFKNTLSNSAGVEDAVLKVSVSEGVDRSTIYRAISDYQ